ncbi:MAG: peptidoglycan DD-metalloendopeptidase family protein [Acidaminococcaceae bacterium]|nr:peptidoglycan DD-metalloendopeptidase family protein [Acidaminococcaceae bacterium]
MRYLIIFLLCLFAQWNICSAETPFVSGGVITSPFGWRIHPNTGTSKFHAGVDVGGMAQGTTIRAPYDGCIVEHELGAGYICSVLIRTPTGIAWRIGDCDPASMDMADGIVMEGTPIGMVGGAYNGPLGFSTGPHMHIEVFPDGNIGYGGSTDPVPYLLAMGMVLDGSVIANDPSGLPFGASAEDDQDLPWGVEGMYELGDNINKDMKYFAEAAAKGFSYLYPIALQLLFLFAIIDIGLPILLTGKINLEFAITKIIKYGLFYIVIANWGTITNGFFLNFIESVSGTLTNDLDIIKEHISQPQIILQKCVYMMTPALNKIASYKSVGFVINLPLILPLFLFTWLTIAVYFLFAMGVALMYIEFYLTALFNIISLPFGMSRFMKFLPEGTLGHLVAVTMQLVTISFMVFLMVSIVKDANPNEVFQINDVAGVIINPDIVSKHVLMCLNLIALAFVSGIIAKKVGNLFGGSIEL